MKLVMYRNQVTANICNGYGKVYIWNGKFNQIERLQIPLLNNADKGIPWADGMFEDNRQLINAWIQRRIQDPLKYMWRKLWENSQGLEAM